MKVKYWMAVYPFHMNEGASSKPAPMSVPIDVSPPAKLLTFTVELPDDLFDGVKVTATLDMNSDRK